MQDFVAAHFGNVFVKLFVRGSQKPSQMGAVSRHIENLLDGVFSDGFRHIGLSPSILICSPPRRGFAAYAGSGNTGLLAAGAAQEPGWRDLFPANHERAVASKRALIDVRTKHDAQTSTWTVAQRRQARDGERNKPRPRAEREAWWEDCQS
jgi:hypothetical protein